MKANSTYSPVQSNALSPKLINGFPLHPSPYVERCRIRTSNTRVSVFQNSYTSFAVLPTTKNTAHYNI